MVVQVFISLATLPFSITRGRFLLLGSYSVTPLVTLITQSCKDFNCCSVSLQIVDSTLCCNITSESFISLSFSFNVVIDTAGRIKISGGLFTI